MAVSLKARRDRARHKAAACAVSCAFLFVAALFASMPYPPPAGHVVLITVDTLRADHLDCYGYSRIKTPNFSRLARDGVLFRNAVTPVPLTLPAHASIFTGTYPAYHGVRDQSGFILSPGSETLASRLKALGMSTGAFVGAFVLDSKFGLSQGFDYYYDRFDATRVKSGMPEMLERRAEAVAAEALRWMEAQSGRRFFAWLHFYDPHTPYAPPEPFRSRYPAAPYDGEVAYTDAVLGRVLDFLVEKGWYRDSLVILAGDHGEDLGDHGEKTHGYFVYDSTVRVPLLIKLPGSQHAGTAVGSQASIVDILPTALQILSAPPSGQAQGRGLLSVLANPSRQAPVDAYGETFYPYYHFGWNPLHYLRTGRFKYIDAPQPELYDLNADPAERRNLAPTDKATAAQLRDRLRVAYSRMAGKAEPKKEPVDSATSERLKSLGYVTFSSRAARLGVKQGLPDPKEKLGIYNLVQEATLESQRGNDDEASRMLEAVLAREPGLTDARIHLGLLHKRAGRFDRAVEQFQLALKGDDSNVVATYNLAHSFAGWGKLPEAILGFKRTLELDPGEVRARVGLGIAYQMQSRLEEARKEYEAALALDPDDSLARKNLGSVFLTLRDPAGALDQLRHARATNPGDAETHNLLGSAHWLNNSPEAAVSEFQESIRLDRKFLDAYVNLGMLLEKMNRAGEAVKYLKTASELSPRSAPVFELLGQAYLSAGMKSASEAAFARARELRSPR